MELPIDAARRLAGDLAEFRRPAVEALEPGSTALPPEDDFLADYDRRVHDVDLRSASRSRFVSTHYADAVEAGVKALSECVRSRSGRTDDGDTLMTHAFSAKSPILRINAGRSKSDESEQRGFMLLCQGVVGAWRNPRAHSLIDDSPARALMMLELLDSLMAITKAATRTRKRRSSIAP